MKNLQFDKSCKQLRRKATAFLGEYFLRLCYIKTLCRDHILPRLNCSVLRENEQICWIKQGFPNSSRHSLSNQLRIKTLNTKYSLGSMIRPQNIFIITECSQLFKSSEIFFPLEILGVHFAISWSVQRTSIGDPIQNEWNSSMIEWFKQCTCVCDYAYSVTAMSCWEYSVWLNSLG